MLFAPHYAQLVPEGPIAVPPQTRVLVVAYENDSFVDNQIGVELYDSFAVPVSQKRHLTVLADYSGTPVRTATHLAPLSFQLPIHIQDLSVDEADPWVVYRPTDITARCALDGTWCDADLEEMGSRPDGRPIKRGIASAVPVDLGASAIQECGFFLNPRPC